MFCAYCGNAIPDDSKFCRFCGKPVQSLPSDQPAEAQLEISPVATVTPIEPTVSEPESSEANFDLIAAVQDVAMNSAKAVGDTTGAAAEAVGNAAGFAVGAVSGVAGATAGAMAGVANVAAGAINAAASTVANSVVEGSKAAAEGAKQVHQMFGGEYAEHFVGNLKDENGEYILPNPVINEREYDEINELAEKYKKLLEPSALAKAGKFIGDTTPEPLKAIAGKVGDAAKDTIDGFTKQDLIAGALSWAATGFKQLEEYAARSTVGRDYVLQRINSGKQKERVEELEEICMLRSYDVAKIANNESLQHLAIAFVEGGSTGAAGFAGIIPNLALSMLIYFRAVQSVAMFYGYDVKNDPAELIIAGDVFSQSMSPNAKGNSTNDYIGKILVYAETATIRKAAKKTWTAVIQTGGAGLLVTQIRALSNAAARKALEKSGKQTLENKVFSNALARVGEKLTLKNLTTMVPIVGAGFGALFDFAQMNKVLEFANLFYHKRFILEKPERVQQLTGQELPPEEPIAVEMDS